MEEDLRSILAQDPDHAATLNALGYTLTNHTDRYEEAADLIERALVLSPGDPAILDSLGWVYYKLGQFAQSEALLGKRTTPSLTLKSLPIWERYCGYRGKRLKLRTSGRMV